MPILSLPFPCDATQRGALPWPGFAVRFFVSLCHAVALPISAPPCCTEPWLCGSMPYRRAAGLSISVPLPSATVQRLAVPYPSKSMRRITMPLRLIETLLFALPLQCISILSHAVAIHLAASHDNAMPLQCRASPLLAQLCPRHAYPRDTVPCLCRSIQNYRSGATRRLSVAVLHVAMPLQCPAREGRNSPCHCDAVHILSPHGCAVALLRSHNWAMPLRISP